MEEPGFPFTRHGLNLAGLTSIPVPVDDEGLRVDDGRRLAPDAALAVVTAGQQPPWEAPCLSLGASPCSNGRMRAKLGSLRTTT